MFSFNIISQLIFAQNEEQNHYFAVKKLNPSDENGINFRNEVSACAKAYGVDGHPHLIRLLSTWHQNQSWYLLFPWAKGNLRDYWYKNRQVPQPDLLLVQWIAEQSLGIAEGLKKIHRSGSDEETSNFNDYGIHGDIKPENILCFDDQDNKYGILVISDFGFTRFHSRKSRSNAYPVGTSPTYRAPEYDSIVPQSSRAYDIWTLACLYLEFITWYLTGSNGVKETFAEQRTKEDANYSIREDKFFNIVSSDSPGDKNKYKAIIKQCVYKVSSL